MIRKIKRLYLKIKFKKKKNKNRIAIPNDGRWIPCTYYDAHYDCGDKD